MTDYHTNVLILGSGPAGCTAAIYASRANRNPILVTGVQPGGQLTITTDVENYPGFAKAIHGPWLMEQMLSQAQHVGTRILHDTITSIDLSKRPFQTVGDSHDIYCSETIIICTGASARWLGLKNEERYQGFGVSACATCDGFFFQDKEVCVIGGGNSAVEEAIHLANHASKVTVIHRRNTLRAERLMQDRLFSNSKITVIWNTVIEDICGTDSPLAVTGVKLRNRETNVVSELSCEGVFIAIGHTPNTDLFKDQLVLDINGYLITAPDSTATSIPGVFAAGDVQDSVYRQAVTAAGTGCMAALEADRFLSNLV